MDVPEDIKWWQDNYPSEYGILSNALGTEWLIESVSRCIGVKWNQDYHPLAWNVFSHNEENFSEVLLVVNLLKTFSSDPQITTIIRNLKNQDDYRQTLLHLMIAYQFFRAGWKISLEIPSQSGKVDFMATQSGEVLFVECSEKMLNAPMPFNERAFLLISSKISSYCGNGINAKIILKTDEASVEELENLLQENRGVLSQFKEKTTLQTPNVELELERRIDGKSAVGRVDRRPSLSIVEKLLDKIDEENRQTKSGNATRVVALQLLGRIAPEEWQKAVDEMGRRLPGKRSKPDAVFFFQKKWVDGQCRLRLIGFILTTQKGEADIFDPTLDFMESNDALTGINEI